MTIALASARRWARNFYHMSRRGVAAGPIAWEIESWSGAAAGKTSVIPVPSLIAHPGIEPGEQDVGDEHADDGEDRQQHYEAAGEIHVLGQQRAIEQGPRSRQVQHDGDDDLAGDHRRQDE